MYTIEVRYKTGNSFNSETCVDNINLTFTTRKLARSALAVIKEHYQLISELESFDNRHVTYDETNRKNSKMAWHQKALALDTNDRYTNDGDAWKSQVAVQVSVDEWRNLNVSMWTGYFETLYGARVISLDDDNDEISFE